MLFTTILGYVLHNNDQLRKDLVDSALGSFPIIGPQLQSQVHTLTGSAFAVVIGSLLLLYGAIGLGLATQSAMNKVGTSLTSAGRLSPCAISEGLLSLCCSPSPRLDQRCLRDSRPSPHMQASRGCSCCRISRR